jgi:hygromycin-B 7''-O-kinase
MVSSYSDLVRERASELESWRPAATTISAAHGVAFDQLQRFNGGESPVFALDDTFVLKLVPSFWRTIAQREIDGLTLLGNRTDLPVAMPRLIAHGHCDDWTYLLSTRVPGEALHRAWLRVPGSGRAVLAQELGAALAALHRQPDVGVRPGGIDWPAFIDAQISRWPDRPEVLRLPTALATEGPRYLAELRDRLIAPPWSLLHGDLAPENALAVSANGSWHLSGIIDFGQASWGSPWFDLTAPSVLLQPGDAATVQSFLEGYLPGGSADRPALRPVLMACTMIHPMADLAECLALLPADVSPRSWTAIASAFWPDA